MQGMQLHLPKLGRKIYRAEIAEAREHEFLKH